MGRAGGVCAVDCESAGKCTLWATLVTQVTSARLFFCRAHFWCSCLKSDQPIYEKSSGFLLVLSSCEVLGPCVMPVIVLSPDRPFPFVLL